MFSKLSLNKKDPEDLLKKNHAFLNVQINSSLSNLYQTVSKLPKDYKDYLLDYFEENGQLDFATLNEFHQEISKILRIERCKCCGLSTIGCICTHILLCCLGMLFTKSGPDLSSTTYFSQNPPVIVHLESINEIITEIAALRNQQEQTNKELEKYNNIRLDSIGNTFI